jgi:hypothetical protein
MPVIEEGSDTGSRTPRDFSFEAPAPKPKRPAPTLRQPRPALQPATRFERSDLVKLTPFTMPAPEPVAPRPLPMTTEGPTAATSQISPQGYGRGLTAPVEGQREAQGYGRGLTYGLATQDKILAQLEGRTVEEKPEPKPKAKRTYEMTWEDYQALSEDQRAAVDFNTLLVGAREKDLNTDYQETPQQRATYEKAVERMFGEDGGSETYAPETMAVLRQVDYENQDEDLDNFLGLKTAITVKELQDFRFDTPLEVKPPQVDTYDAKRALGLPIPAAGPEQPLASGADALAASMAKANQLLQTFQDSAAMNRNEDLRFFGGLLNDPKMSPGFGQPEPDGSPNIHTFFQEAYDNLAIKGADVDATWNTITSTLRPDEVQQFMQYADIRSGQAENYGLELGESKGLRTPEEFRKLLGLEASDG